MPGKVLLILVDGLRPDAVTARKENYLNRMAESCAHTFAARCVIPSVTLPCHVSLFSGVSPKRHGILTNTYVPPARPVDSIFDVAYRNRRMTGSFYNWEELRDLGKPRGVSRAEFYDMDWIPDTDRLLARHASEYILEYSPDFVFLYLGETDGAGHNYGWMTETYLDTVTRANECIRGVVEAIPEDYTVFVTADHGGHDQCHGTDRPEDMLIPLLIKGRGIPNVELADASILDIAPTVCRVMGMEKPREWEGRELL